MYGTFKYNSIPLAKIFLDAKNPRIVTQKKLSTQNEILKYLFEHEDLELFIRKIATEGKNQGAERPYVVKVGDKYTVVEGNTRIAAYKVLTGLLTPPHGYASSVPNIAEKAKGALLDVDCSIAPSRDALLPIMANAHFGLGDKSKWGYLGSRKAVYDEWRAGKSVPKLAKTFDRTPRQIRELILEYRLYLKALGLQWSAKEKAALLNPAVEFNPPVRFLQTKGHKQKMGISYDDANLTVIFAGKEAEKKFKHLIAKLVICPQKGLGATATFDAVFADYKGKKPSGTATSTAGRAGSSAGTGSPATSGGGGAAKQSGAAASRPDTLFAYPVTVTNALVSQLMREAKDLSYKRYPASATFLLRNVVEAILKHIIDQQKANPASKALDLEAALNLCLSSSVSLSTSDKKVLKEFKGSHLSYLNLGSHGNVIPNPDRVAGARDCIDQFVKKYV